MILESIVTTVDTRGKVNVAPMGPSVNPDITEIALRPFRSSQTFANLHATGRAVVHVTDDCLLLARAAVGQVDFPLELTEAIDDGKFHPLRDACRWYAVQVTRWVDSDHRPEAICQIVHTRKIRDYFGLNRAKHAVVEAAILATRVTLLPAASIREDIQRLRILVDKTGGDSEKRAFQLLEDSIAAATRTNS